MILNVTDVEYAGGTSWFVRSTTEGEDGADIPPEYLFDNGVEVSA